MKSKAAKRKRQAQIEVPQKHLKPAPVVTVDPDAAALGPSLHSIISDEEISITVETLVALAQYPNLIKSKACRDIRTAVYDFRQASTTGMNTAGTNLAARITAALTDEKYTDVRILLAEMRIRGEEPKLGSLCRWVRDLDVISGLSTVPESADRTEVERTEKAKLLITVMDAVLRTLGPADSNPNAISHPTSPIVLQEIWNLRPSTPSEEVYASVLDKSIFDKVPAPVPDYLRIIETTPGPERKPPNHHPAVLYTTLPNSVTLSTIPPTMTHHKHPNVPGLSLAQNLLSPEECRAVIAAGERAGFIPDAPLREDGDISILAHNFYWVVDTAFHDILWSRISPFVPAKMDGRIARGINRRFRVYRYVPGAEYRCHIDGAWPPSGILPDDTYVYDSSPKDKKQSSLFTFLIYLNDEFEGGETTFFIPAQKEGTLNAYPVKPVMGAVAMFPHGETRGALLHEGTGVRKGAKYIIRTDIEYDVEVSDE
ncbi:prolyl 4-hydroxylase [Plectosphaerella cucumerina]|uniref:Prolyl 4-hydroxylase n=1 Tax=Plectosphaerella cucumerina TaxID=40658 RepID=A0A8K0X5L7_9PEZI|nr:prolyl 4-hydroxylase [Plectosphaerella cucumerina]